MRSFPIQKELRPFGCRECAPIPVQGKSHKSRSQDIMWTKKDFKTIGGARFYPPTLIRTGHAVMSCGTHDPKLIKYDIMAQLMEEGCVEDYQYLVGTTPFKDEDRLLYVIQKVYVGRSPVGEVILVNRAPIHRNDLVSSRANTTPAHVEDILRLTGEVLMDEE